MSNTGMIALFWPTSTLRSIADPFRMTAPQSPEYVTHFRS